jgi:hypothetical protein
MRLWRLYLLAALTIVAACADAPTSPVADLEHVSGPLRSGKCLPTGDGTYLCPPQSPDWGDGCDPYHYDCGADDCIESRGSLDASGVEGCTGGGGDIGDGGGDWGGPGGGGGGGGGGGAGVPECPDYGCEEPSPPHDEDYIEPGSDIPDCTQPVFLDWERAYCDSQPPSGERLTRTQNSLQRVETRGSECANIAAFGRQLLAAGKIRYFPSGDYGNVGGWGDPEMGALLDEAWVDDFGGTATGYGNFDMKLVHEIEHAMGRGHVEGSTETPHSASCAGFST